MVNSIDRNELIDASGEEARRRANASVIREKKKTVNTEKSVLPGQKKRNDAVFSVKHN